jgi:tripartite-type tricarboxylate transporter receptor subunit TctC
VCATARCAHAERAGAVANAQQDYPNRPIRYISPFAPGGSTTVIARLVGKQLTEAWGQQVVVDNRGGANTVIGTQLAANSPPDGYTLVSLGRALAGNYWLLKTPVRSPEGPRAHCHGFELRERAGGAAGAAGQVGRGPDRHGEGEAGEITYGTSSTVADAPARGALQHRCGIKTLHVPYKGGGPAVIDLMGGHIDFFFSNPINIAAHVKNGRLRALAVTGQSRAVAFPDVPTFAEQGFPAMTLTNWQGVGGPAGIPQPIIDKISAEIKRLVTKPDMKAKLNALGSEPFYNDPKQTAALIRSDIDATAGSSRSRTSDRLMDTRAARVEVSSSRHPSIL